MKNTKSSMAMSQLLMRTTKKFLPLKAGETREETLYLLRSVEEYQTIVRGRKAKREVTRRVIERDDVLKVAGTQGDAIRVIENLPGTARDSGGGGGPANGPVLRGSNPGDSKIYIEGHEIPILYHFGGPSFDVQQRLSGISRFCARKLRNRVWPRHRWCG